ncbi:MAG: CHAT domain-containing protein [Vicinamibacterales bacterium]
MRAPVVRLAYLILPLAAAVGTIAVVWPARPDGGARRPELAVRQALDGGRFIEAERLAAQWRAAAESTSGSDSLEAARASDYVVEALARNGRSGDPATAVLAERVVRLKERLLGPIDPELGRSLRLLGWVHTERGEDPVALPLLERAVSIYERSPEFAGQPLAESLDALAVSQLQAERLDEAEVSIGASLGIRAEGGENPAGLANTLYLQSILLAKQGDYDRAEAPLERALTVRKGISADHPDVALLLEHRAYLQFMRGHVVAARDGWSAALTLAEQTLGAEHPVVARILRWLALASRSLGDLSSARTLTNRAFAIASARLNRCNDTYVGVISALSTTAEHDGDYDKARQLNATLEGIGRECRGPTHSLTVTAIYNQAFFAHAMGDLLEAERLAQEAVRLWTAALGPRHPYVARALAGLADVVRDAGQLEKAKHVYEQALDVQQQSLGADHPLTGTTLISLAETAVASGDFQGGLHLAEQSIRVFRLSTGDNPDALARALILKGEIETRLGSLANARRSFQEALSRREAIFGLSHPLAAAAQVRVATSDFAAGALDSALEVSLVAEQTGRDHLRFTIRYLPERQALAYATKRPRGLDLALSIAADRPSGESVQVLDALVRSRAVVLDELAIRASRVADGAAQSNSSNAALTSAHQRFANLMLKSFGLEQSVPSDILQAARREKEQAERALAERSAGERAEFEQERAGLEEVRKALPESSALVSFVRYERTTVRRPGATVAAAPSYLAFVMRSDTAAVKVVPLGAAPSIESLVDRWRAQFRAVGSVRAYRIAAGALRARVWDPISEAIGGANRVFIVPDGVLNLVSFGSLPLADGRYLAESGLLLHYLAAERDVVGIDPPTGNGLLVVGGVAFDDQGGNAAPGRSVARGCPPGSGLTFEDLPGTRAEIVDLTNLWSAVAGADGSPTSRQDDVRTLTAFDASESAVVQLAKGRRVVHLATHAFFFEEDCVARPMHTRAVGAMVAGVRTPVPQSNPFVLAGLALAGANQHFQRPSDDDGILTAEEVAGLDLQGVEWAVLSACDTGIGEVHEGEGVLGLRRAFQIAGARTVITSLWSVDDRATRRWMRALYENRFRKGLDTAHAVRAATLDVLAEQRLSKQSTHPFYWAGFVAAGRWH